MADDAFSTPMPPPLPRFSPTQCASTNGAPSGTRGDTRSTIRLRGVHPCGKSAYSHSAV